MGLERGGVGVVRVVEEEEEEEGEVRDEVEVTAVHGC